MRHKSSRLRQRLWQQYRRLGRLLPALTPSAPMIPGSFYLMRRKCGKSNCRCARGQLHPGWVLTRSEAGRHKLYSVPASERARLRQHAGTYRHWQQARARFVKETLALLALADQFAQTQTLSWPRSQNKTPRR